MQTPLSAPIQAPTIYRKRLSFDHEPLLSQYCIDGIGVFPAAGQLEMVLAGVQHMMHSDAFQLRDFSFINPLRVAPGETVTTEMAFTKQGESHAVSLKSVTESASIEHCSGKIDYRSSAVPQWSSLPELRRRFDRPVDPDRLQDWYRGCGIEYGPTFRTVAELQLSASDQHRPIGEALMLLRDGQNSNLLPFILKPTLFDGALHGLGMLLDHLNGGPLVEGVFLPYYLGELEVYAPLRGTVWCWASKLAMEGHNGELLRGQLTLMNAQGQKMVQVKDIILKRSSVRDVRGPSRRVISIASSEPVSTAKATQLPTLTAPALEDYFHRVHWQPSAEPARQVPMQGRWLLLGDDGPLHKSLSQQLRQQGSHCIEVLAGRRFQRIETDRYLCDPTSPQDFEQLLEVAGGIEQLVGVVHAWQVCPSQAHVEPKDVAMQLEEGVKSAILLAQSVGNRARKPLRFVLITADAQAVTEDVPTLIPTRSAMWGVGRTVALEYRHLQTTCIDVSSADHDASAVADWVLGEIGQTPSIVEVAYRRGRRYVPRLIHQAPQSAIPWSVRRGGVYLISGGLGDLGLTIADYLAKQGARKLLLLNRSRYLPASTDKLSEQDLHQLRIVEGIRQRGVEVLTPQGDVTDLGFVRQLTKAEGPIHGVVHCAGVLRDGLIGGKSLASIDEVLAPKVSGTLSLAAATEGSELDFFILFSSLSSVLGNYGQVDYAAANTFLDAYATHAQLVRGHRVMSLNWGPWRGRGMLANDPNASSSDREFETIDTELGCALFEHALRHPMDQWVLFRRVSTSKPSTRADINTASSLPAQQRPSVGSRDNDGNERVSPSAISRGQMTYEANAVAIAKGAELVMSDDAATPCPPPPSPQDPFSHLGQQVVDHLTRAFAKALMVPEQELDPDADPLALGLDSLMVVDIKSTLETSDFVLDPALFFRYPTIKELSQHLLESYPNELAAVLGSPKGHTDLSASFPTYGAKAESAGAVTTSQYAPRVELMSTPHAYALPSFLRQRIDELSAEDVESVKRGDYFYEPVISELDGASVKIGEREMLMLASYSYLGLMGHPKINAAAKAAIERFGTGTHGARLLTGTNILHRELEQAIARFKGTEDAVVFSSGFITNVTTISSLVRKGDVIIGDIFNHASIADGCLQSGARFLIFGHNDMRDLERCLVEAGDANKLVVVDAVFSMDGDIANLPDLTRLCKQYGAALMVDEAHSLGVLGATGRGIEEHFGLPPGTVDIKMGTLSKTVPSGGGYIAGCRELIFALKNNARAFIFSAALPPAQAAAAKAALEVIQEEPERIGRLRRNTHHYIDAVKRLGFHTYATETSIVPIICTTSEQAIRMARSCQAHGIFVQPIVYPAVPINAPRLRTIITAAHTREDIDFVLETLVETGRDCGLIGG